MKTRLIIYSYYTLFWLFFFIVIRILFLLYHYPFSSELNIGDWFLINFYGSKLDISVTAYILLIPCVFAIITSYFRGKWLYYIINTYTILLLFVISFLTIIDIEIYKHWGFRLDCTPLIYINTPKEMLASVELLVIVKLLLLGLCIFLVSVFIYFRLIAKKLKYLKPANWKVSILFLFITGLLIVPIRGGVGLAPVNIGSVYFHNNNFANHAAINGIWNLSYSLTKRKKINNVYNFFENNKAEKIFDELYKIPDDGKDEAVKVLKSGNPNIILIILESFSAKLIEVLDGKQGITPNINRLSREGILFRNFYASGDRTDKAIIAILSGYPALPYTSIINFPQKTQNLPFLIRDLKEKGYHTAFYYGGDIDFANIRSYLVNGQFDEIISKKDFRSSTNNSKWGVHDHIVFNKLFKDINNRDTSESPFFYVLFTLSSHEPYDVPMKTVVKGDDDESKFLNSAYYTDKAVGKFIENAKKQDWWDNTLFILVADHGSRHPGNSPYNSIAKFRIPMLWLGGALIKHDTLIHTYASQTDIAKTILQQIGYSKQEIIYPFSKNIFSQRAGIVETLHATFLHSGFAFFVFNDGFGFVSDRLKLVYDNVSNKYIVKKGTYTDKDLQKGKAYLQVVYDDFVNK